MLNNEEMIRIVARNNEKKNKIKKSPSPICGEVEQNHPDFQKHKDFFLFLYSSGFKFSE